MSSIIPFQKPQTLSEDFEAQAADGDLRSQFIIFCRQSYALHRMLAEAMEQHDAMMGRKRMALS